MRLLGYPPLLTQTTRPHLFLGLITSLGRPGCAEALQGEEWLAWPHTVECEAMDRVPANSGCSEISGSSASQACRPPLTRGHSTHQRESHHHYIKNETPETKGAVIPKGNFIISDLIWGPFREFKLDANVGQGTVCWINSNDER